MWMWNLDEALDERSLPDPGLTANESHAAVPCERVSQSGLELAQAAVAFEELHYRQATVLSAASIARSGSPITTGALGSPVTRVRIGDTPDQYSKYVATSSRSAAIVRGQRERAGATSTDGRGLAARHSLGR
jgi:hypothetical protein